MAAKKKVAKKKTTVRKLRTELKSAISGKKPVVKKAFSIKDKRDALNQLLACKEEQEKINAAMVRLNKRDTELRYKRDKICKNLAVGLVQNKENPEDAMLYKGMSFKLEPKLHWHTSDEYDVIIETLKKL